MPRSSPPDTLRGPGPRPPRDPRIGDIVEGRFVIEERIATGGYAVIYRARDTCGERVALKILHPALGRDPRMVARFRREGEVLMQLRDPHTVRTLAVGETSDGARYIAMELLGGESLHDHLRRVGVLRWQDAVRIARAVGRSLAEAHALGIVHRDLKPANIHVERGPGDERVKVLDFGIAKLAPGSAVDDGDELTRVGQLIGTYDHMAPEQLAGATCDARSDIYALGVVLYEMLTGARPYSAATGPASMMAAMVTEAPRPPSIWAELPAELDAIVLRCLSREPEDRFASIAELDAALAPLLALAPGVTDEQTVLGPSVPIVDDEGAWREAPPVPEPSTPAQAAPPAPAPTSSLATTLPGVGVAPRSRPRKASVFDVPALASPPVPASPPQLWAWAPAAPASSQGPLARGSSAVLPAPSARRRWLAAAVVCVMATALALAAVFLI